MRREMKVSIEYAMVIVKANSSHIGKTQELAPFSIQGMMTQRQEDRRVLTTALDEPVGGKRVKGEGVRLVNRSKYFTCVGKIEQCRVVVSTCLASTQLWIQYLALKKKEPIKNCF
jgi:hypothetical protein